MKILIIDDEIKTRDQLISCFKKDHIIEATNGLDAVEKLKEKYDLIFLDLIMPIADGFHVLNYIKSKNIKTKVIILSSLSNNFTIKRVSKYDIEYFVCKPFSNKTINEVINNISKDKHIVVGHSLNKLGISLNLKGYDYLRDIIELIINENIININLSKDIYPKIALKYNITPSSVERSIRNAIELSFTEDNLEVLEKFFHKVDPNKGKVTNLVYIKTIHEYIINNMI